MRIGPSVLLARAMLREGNMSKEPNQGEGDRASARRYDKHLREFIHEGKVPPAAQDARTFVEREPENAKRAERSARRGPRGHFTEEILAKGRALFQRMREAAQRARARFG
ncbi:MAG TPA: hypothetical protein VG871_23370 [Vicinamibacterales bacterium]|nr:hypothetical protein [Vicinamibacterales bacterium]